MPAALVFLVTHSWSSKPTLEQEECYRITVFASKNPKNPMLWATVLSSYYFGGNGESIDPLLTLGVPWSPWSGCGWNQRCELVRCYLY